MVLGLKTFQICLYVMKHSDHLDQLGYAFSVFSCCSECSINTFTKSTMKMFGVNCILLKIVLYFIITLSLYITAQ